MKRSISTWLVLVAVLGLGGIAHPGSPEWAPDDNESWSDGDPRLLDWHRQPVYDDIVAYRVDLRVGGPGNQIALHRVVREAAPWQPVAGTDGVFLLHGDGSNFETCFVNMLADPAGPSDFGLAVYLAAEGLDVWGLDMRWTFATAATESKVAARWDLATELGDVETGLRLARSARDLSGSGAGQLTLGGFSSGAALAIAFVNEETQRPSFRRHVKGLVPIDFAFGFGPDAESLRSAAHERFLATSAAYDMGTYLDDTIDLVQDLASLAMAAPAAASPVEGAEGLTNRQFFLVILTATHATFAPLSPYVPQYHYLAGTFDAYGLPSGLQYSDLDKIFDFVFAAPPYNSMAAIRDIEAIMAGGLVDTPYDDHLADITVPVFYLGAAGGFGAAAVYGVDAMGSRDKTVHIVRLWEPNDEVLDFGHVDLLSAEMAATLAWQPLAEWLAAH